jgi:beta-phosphoglucomutase-like phosphatase (HAD superfamily)
MLLLAYLMTRTEAWEGARIRLLGICCSDVSTDTADSLRSTLDEVRIEAEAVLVEEADAGVVAQRSADASLVLLPFRLRGDRPLGPFDGPLEALLAPLPVTALVLAAEDMDLDAEPEEGEAAEAAQILDSLSDVGRLAELTAQDARKADEAVQARRAELEAAATQPGGAEAVAQLKGQLHELEVQAEKARRRAARFAARLQAVRQEAQSLGIAPVEQEGEQPVAR